MDDTKGKPLDRALLAALILTVGALPLIASAGEEPKAERQDEVRRQIYVLKSGDDEAVQEKLIEAHAVRRGFLGVHLLDLTPELRSHYGAPEGAGVMVSRVEEESPAQAAELRVGDVLVALDGEEIASSSDLARRVGKKGAGDKVEIELIRDGARRQLSATLSERERSQLDIGSFFSNPGADGPGRHHLTYLGPGGDFERRVIQIDIDEEELQQTIEELQKRIDPDARVHILRMQEDREALQERLQEMEKRLEEMERRLERLGAEED